MNLDATKQQYTALIEACSLCALRGRSFRAYCMMSLAKIEGFDWCGVYRLEGDTLVLDEYVGAVTDHTHIPVGRGVCGTAVAEDRNQIVDDVRELTNYLSCSLETRSEAVVLIRRDGTVIGQIDIDGHKVGTFRQSEVALLECLATMIGDRWDGPIQP